MADPTPDPLSARSSDGGPIYTETNFDHLIKEPWNAASAALFVLIVAVWAVRLALSGGYRGRPFLCLCLAVLLVGGIGGTLYHAFRSARLFFLMDVLPIQFLGLGAAIYLWARLRPPLWHLLAVLAFFFLVTVLAFPILPPHQFINLSYALLALMLLLPLLFVLLRLRFRHSGWVGLALVCFGVALFFRYADAWRPPLLPTGTHWLWHTFGAACTAALTEFFYRLEGEPLRAVG